MWMDNQNRHYKNAESWELHIHDYHNPVLYELVKQCRYLYEFSQEEDRSDLFSEFNQEIRILINRLISLPLPYDDILSGYADTTSIKNKSRSLSRFYPEGTEIFRGIAETVDQLKSEPQPVLDLLKELSEKKKSRKSAFRVDNAGTKPLVEELFIRHQIPFSVMTRSELKQSSPPFSLITTGPIHWYTGSTLLPEARNLHIIKPAWLSSKARFNSPFTEGESYIEFAVEMSQPKIRHFKVSAPNDKPLIEIEDAAIPERRTLFLKSLKASESQYYEYEEKCQAYPLLLADQTVTFLREDSRTHILTMSDGKNPQIDFTPAHMVQPEQFMLFKNTDDDTSEFFGDKLLMQHGINWKEEMAPWKKALEHTVKHRGYPWVESQLRVYGSDKASRQNIDNWIYRAIAPKSDNDFKAILRLAGMDNELKSLRTIAAQVKGARQSAAHEIRHLMNSQLEQADLQTLSKTGVQEIDLLNSGIPQYVAVRIIETGGIPVITPTSKLRKQSPFSGKFQI